MTTIKASLVTAINVLVASSFSIAAIIRPQYLVPSESVPTEASLLFAVYAAARTIPLALFALGAIYKQATPALLILGALAGAMQLLDAGIGLFERDLDKCAGPLFIAALQFFVVYLLYRSVRITPQTKRGYQGVADDFAQDLTTLEKRLIFATQGQASSPNEVEAKLTTIAWKQKPDFYIVADQDRMIDPKLEAKIAEQMHATTIHISSSHVPMLSHPTEVANFIAAAAGK
jgi:pimeloyl-ACP methyl ester carboxylesterase